MLTRSSQQLNAVPNQTIINNMYRIANIVLFVLAIFVVMGCSCSKTLCERNIQDDILNIDKFRKQSKKEYRYIEEDAERLFANSAAVYPDTLYRQQYTSLQGISMEKLDLTYIVYGMHSLMPIIGNTIVVNVRH